MRVWLQRVPPWLPAARPPEARARYVSPEYEGEAGPTLVVWERAGGAAFELVYADGIAFIVDRRGTEVWATWPPHFTVDDAAVYLLGPVLGFVLRLRGIVCLHASGVVVDGRAIALLGPGGAGKSTTAAAFARRGYPVLSDDLLALSGDGEGWRVAPGYPGLRLWPDAVGSLYGSPDALPWLTPTWEKRHLDLEALGYRFHEQPVTLGAIYILRDRHPGVTTVGPAPTRAAMMSLVTHTYCNYLLDRPMRAREFDLLGRLVRSVPVRQVSPRDDPARVDDLCDRLLDDIRSLSSPGRTARAV